MFRKVLPIVIGLLVIACMLPACGSSNKAATLSIVTAGDTNMEELQRNTFGPEFVKTHPKVTINVVGTGPGDAGSQAVYTKLKAQKDAGTKTWDIDVAIIHQSIMGQMIADGLLLKYVPDTNVAKYVISGDSTNALGTDVTGYVIPMFHSQTAIAYNPAKVPNPPKSYAELVEWIKANPNRFGYNGVKGGMSGVAFTAGYLYWKTGKYDLLAKGPYDKANETGWVDIFKEMKTLPAVITQGNAGTLDMLNRGEIDMGPVWVDMFLLWKSDGRMDPKMRMILIEPGMPGQPMYVVITAKSANAAVAKQYAEFICSPKQQADVIVGKMGWYPGIDATQVLPNASEASKASLFGDISAETLNKFGLTFPLSKYMTDMNTAYEEAK